MMRMMLMMIMTTIVSKFDDKHEENDVDVDYDNFVFCSISSLPLLGRGWGVRLYGRKPNEEKLLQFLIKALRMGFVSMASIWPRMGQNTSHNIRFCSGPNPDVHAFHLIRTLFIL